MMDGRRIPGLDGTTCWICEVCGHATNGERTMPCKCPPPPPLTAKMKRAERREAKREAKRRKKEID